VVPLDRPVSVQLDAVRVEAALDSLLYGTGVAPTVDRTGQILLITDRDGSNRSSQTGSIAGTVKDGDTGGPITAATVTVVSTRFTAQTDAEGRFTIGGVPAGSYRLRARMLGYTAADTSAVVEDGQQSVMDLRLKRSPIELNPVVAIGYATIEKRDLTGAVASVSGDQFETKAAPTVTLSGGLQGKIAGVQVTSNSGMPGVGIRVRVRGTGSISANSEPLYVIDGLPAEQGAGGDNDDAREQKLRYLLSGNFTRQEGIVLGSDFNRYGVRLNLDGDASSRFRWGSSLSLTRVARNAARVENGAVGNSANGLQAAMQFAPFAAPKDA